MIEVREGNVVEALLLGEIDYLVHCTNSRGKYASGVAGEIRKRIPEAYTAYMNQCSQWINHGNKHIPLGDLSSAKGVINLCGQLNYGYDKKRYVNYGAVASGFCDLFCYLQDIDSRQSRNIKIGLPLIGCGLAGGEETIMMELIEHCLGGIYKSVTVYKL
tara:strand:- start:3974 stop:4453 length:480 start_codon:yes stop_codon:yes gene_type:complete